MKILSELGSRRNAYFCKWYLFGLVALIMGVSGTSYGQDTGQYRGSLISHLQADDLKSTYDDLLKSWVGPADGGMWVRKSVGVDVGLWEWGIASNSLYSYWKITNSADTKLRLRSVWNWMKSKFGTKALSVCGSHVITVYGGNWALDDTFVNAFQFLEYYEVTGDEDALRAAKDSLDCGWARWQDDGAAGCPQDKTPSGGLWYSDECTVKSNTQNEFALTLYIYYQFTGDQIYRNRAVVLDAWVGNFLQRFSGSVGSNPTPGIDCNQIGKCTSLCPNNPGGPYIDGVYWNGINANGYTQGLDPTMGLGTPCQIAERGSATALAPNMAEAILLARLYNDPLTSASDRERYFRRLVVGSQGIKSLETGCGSGGRWCSCTADKEDVLLDDKDAFGDGIFAVLYVREVVPLTAGQPDTLSQASFVRTASVIHALDRGADGTYGGSWAGPPGADNCWSRGGSVPQKLTVTAQTINVIFAAFVGP